MLLESNAVCCAGRLLLPGALCFSASLFAQVPVVTETNAVIRVMASNLSSGSNMRYETPGLRILKGLKPDMVAMQEFNCSNSFGINTPAALRSMIDNIFGTNFSYFRESGYAIPNGIISRYPLTASGSWVDSDTGVNDRGFAWARIDLPGTNDLYVVSVHLKAGNTTDDVSRRAAEVSELTALISTNIPTGAWTIVGGDLNVYSETEVAITNFASFLSDSPVPTDLNGGTNTNLGRSQRYDRVLTSFSLTNALIPVFLPSNILSNGLVFISTNYVPLGDVPPVQYGDSVVSGMQHMAVVRDFTIAYANTNFVVVDPPALTFEPPGILRWQGDSNLTYTVQVSTNLAQWGNLGTATSTTSSFAFTNLIGGNARQFYRVAYP